VCVCFKNKIKIKMLPVTSLQGQSKTAEFEVEFEIRESLEKRKPCSFR